MMRKNDPGTKIKCLDETLHRNANADLNLKPLRTVGKNRLKEEKYR